MKRFSATCTFRASALFAGAVTFGVSVLLMALTMLDEHYRLQQKFELLDLGDADSPFWVLKRFTAFAAFVIPMVVTPGLSL